MRIPKLVHVVVAGACVSLAGIASADDHTQHDKTMTATANSSQGSQELHQAMMQGMQDMHQMKMTGDTDHDFASMMIEHHEQAIAMAKVQLNNGKDAQVRKKAQEIISASEKDIADLKKWNSAHGEKTAAD